MEEHSTKYVPSSFDIGHNFGDKNRNYDKIVSIIFLILMYSKRVDKILHNLNGQGQDGIDIISPRYRMFYIERKTPKRHFSPFGNDKHLKPDETLTLVAVVL